MISDWLCASRRFQLKFQLLCMRTAFPAAVMIFGHVGGNADADAYVDTSQTIVVKLPWIDSKANGRLLYVCQKNSAPPHKVLKTQDWMAETFHHHITPNLWPTHNSPDPNQPL
ncbi:hypothetical protein ACTXT7_005898 [Hymenolepis weldensis]